MAMLRLCLYVCACEPFRANGRETLFDVFTRETLETTTTVDMHHDHLITNMTPS